MSNRRLKILIINLHSTHNAGDAALLEMALSVLSVFGDSQITLAMNEPDRKYESNRVRVVRSFTAHFARLGSDRQRYWQIEKIVKGLSVSLVAALWFRLTRRLPKWLPHSWRELFSAYAGADIVVSCPGNVFVTTGRIGMPFLASAYAVAYALMIGKPLYVLPQSIGPLKRWWERKLVRYLYLRARLVFIREPVSYRFAQKIGLSISQMHLVPDLAFAYPPAFPREAEDILNKWIGQYERPLIGVTVINRLVRQVGNKIWDQYERAMAQSLSSFLEKYGGTVVFFPQVIGPTGKEDDRVAAYRIVAQMENPSRAIIISEYVPPGVLKAIYGLTDVFIATRMHSAIFAIGMGIPTLLIGYLHKMRGLAEMLSLEDWLLELEEITESSLWEKIQALWNQRVIVREHLSHIVSQIDASVSGLGQVIAEDFYGRQAKRFDHYRRFSHR